MAAHGDSLANTLNFLAQQGGMQQRQIPAPSQAALDVQQTFQNPAQRPRYQNPILAALFGGANGNAPSLANGMTNASTSNGIADTINQRNKLLADMIEQNRQ